jgi:hypothetical protein
VKMVILGKPDRRIKAGRPKLRWFRLYWEQSEMDGCQEIMEESTRHTCMGYHSEGGTV